MTEPALVPSTTRSRDAVRQAWIERLARFDAATLTTAQFCAAEGVSVASFYHWKRRLTPRPENTPTTEDAPRLLPVRVTAAPPPLELLLPGGAVLRLSPGCDLDLVRSLLATLGAIPC